MRKMYDAEQNVSKLCAKLVSNSKLKKRDKNRIHHYIDNYEENHFKLADKQKEAIESDFIQYILNSFPVHLEVAKQQLLM